MDGREKHMNELRKSEQAYTVEIPKALKIEGETIQRLGREPAHQADCIKKKMDEHISTYLEARENGGQTFPDFIGAAALDELALCRELSAKYRAKCLVEDAARQAEVEEEHRKIREETNRKADEQIQKAVHVLKHGGVLENEMIHLYRADGGLWQLRHRQPSDAPVRCGCASSHPGLDQRETGQPPCIARVLQRPQIPCQKRATGARTRSLTVSTNSLKRLVRKGGSGMKIVMNRLEALSLAKAAESIAPSKATMDELRCVLLESGEDGKLTMAATNNEVALEQRMPAQIQEAGALLINAKLFANMLSVLGGETVTIKERTAGRRRSKRYMPLHHPDPACVQLPPRGDPFPEDTVTVKNIPSMAARTVFAAAENEGKPAMRCVKLVFTSDGLKAVSYDGSRLASAKG